MPRSGTAMARRIPFRASLLLLGLPLVCPAAEIDRPAVVWDRRVPRAVDTRLRKRPRAERRSLNSVALEALAKGAGVDSQGPQRLATTAQRSASACITCGRAFTCAATATPEIVASVGSALSLIPLASCSRPRGETALMP